MPCDRFSAGVVNQYCQTTARTCCGGPCGKGFPEKSSSTSASPRSKLSSVRTTIGSCRHELSDANHKFQSNLGWDGAEIPSGLLGSCGLKRKGETSHVCPPRHACE